MRFGFFIGLFFTMASHAQVVTDIQPVDVTSKEYKVTAVIYSSRAGQALIGLTRDNGARTLGTFAECRAPRGPLSSQIALADVGDCFVHSDNWFEVSPENQAKFDKSFAYNLKSFYEQQYRNEVWGANSVTMFMYPLLGAVLTGANIYAGVQSWRLIKSGYRVRGALAMAGVAGLGLLVGFWDYLSISHFMYVNHATVPSLESQVIEQYKNLLAQNPETPKIDFSKVHWALNYEVMKRAINTSIASLAYQ